MTGGTVPQPISNTRQRHSLHCATYSCRLDIADARRHTHAYYRIKRMPPRGCRRPEADTTQQLSSV